MFFLRVKSVKIAAVPGNTRLALKRCKRDTFQYDSLTRLISRLDFCFDRAGSQYPVTFAERSTALGALRRVPPAAEAYSMSVTLNQIVRPTRILQTSKELPAWPLEIQFVQLALAKVGEVRVCLNALQQNNNALTLLLVKHIPGHLRQSSV